MLGGCGAADCGGQQPIPDQTHTLFNIFRVEALQPPAKRYWFLVKMPHPSYGSLKPCVGWCAGFS